MSGRVWGVWEEGGGRCKRNEIREREREREIKKRDRRKREAKCERELEKVCNNVKSMYKER